MSFLCGFLMDLFRILIKRVSMNIRNHLCIYVSRTFLGVDRVPVAYPGRLYNVYVPRRIKVSDSANLPFSTRRWIRRIIMNRQYSCLTVPGVRGGMLAKEVT